MIKTSICGYVSGLLLKWHYPHALMEENCSSNHNSQFPNPQQEKENKKRENICVDITVLGFFLRKSV